MPQMSVNTMCDRWTAYRSILVRGTDSTMYEELSALMSEDERRNLVLFIREICPIVLELRAAAEELARHMGEGDEAMHDTWEDEVSAIRDKLLNRVTIGTGVSWAVAGEFADAYIAGFIPAAETAPVPV